MQIHFRFSKPLKPAIVEIVLLLFILLWPVIVFLPSSIRAPIFYGLIFSFPYIFILPIILSQIQKTYPFVEDKRSIKLLYFLATCAVIALSSIFWFPSLVIAITFCISFYLFIANRGASAKKFFIVLYIFASLLLVLSGHTPFGFDSLIFAIFSILPTLMGLWLYLRAISQKGLFLIRPRVTLMLGVVYLFFISFLLYMVGGRTGWLVKFIPERKGMELLLAPTTQFLEPRVVVPLKDGLLIYTSLDQFILFRDQKFEKFTYKLGGVDSLICDLEDETICYVPSARTGESGLAIINNSLWQVTNIKLQPAKYYRIDVSSEQMRYMAIIEDSGRYLAIVKREAPGVIEKVAELDSFELAPRGRTYFVNFVAQKLMIITKSKNNIYGFFYDPENKSLHKFLETNNPAKRALYSHGITAKDGLIVIPLVGGRVIVFDANTKESRTGYLLPFLRQTYYDPRRNLCYIVSDLGFLFIYDPWNAKNIKTLFLGYKPKNVHQAGDYIYIGSTSGIFRIAVDKVLQKDDE